MEPGQTQLPCVLVIFQRFADFVNIFHHRNASDVLKTVRVKSPPTHLHGITRMPLAAENVNDLQSELAAKEMMARCEAFVREKQDLCELLWKPLLGSIGM